MDETTIIGLVGVLIGSVISILVTYLSHRWVERSGIRKIEIEREDKAISEVFSPLVFILQKSQDVIAAIAAIQDALKHKDMLKNKDITFGLHYIVAKTNMTNYPKAIEELLLHKSDLIGNSLLYFDLGILHSYLSTLIDFIGMASERGADTEQLYQYFSALSPLAAQLSEAVSQIRMYAMARTGRLRKQQYSRFFTEKRYQELEANLDKAHKILTGENIVDWEIVLRRLKEACPNNGSEE